MINERASVLSRGRRRTWLALGLAVALAVAVAAPAVHQAQAQSAGGPVVLMGIDAEDGGPGSHGPIGVYVDVVNSILSEVTNGGSGILVVGEGAESTNAFNQFWDAIGNDTGQSITYVAGADDIADVDFSGHAMIGVVSSEHEVVQSPGADGLTEAENAALTDRADDIATFVNAGGGLLGFSQSGLATPYGYVDGIGDFDTTGNLSYSTITPTDEGLAVGITTALNVCCWHDVFDEFPDFLDVLAYSGGSPGGDVAAIGGVQVTLPGGEPTPSGSESLRLVKLWFDEDGAHTGVGPRDSAATLTTEDGDVHEPGPTFAVTGGTDYTVEGGAPDGWSTIACDGDELDLPDEVVAGSFEGDDIVAGGTGDFTVSDSGVHLLCAQEDEVEVLAEVLDEEEVEEAEPAEAVEAEPTFTG